MVSFKSPIDAPFTPLAWDKFGAVRPRNIDPSGVPHTGVDLRPHENGGTRNVYAIADGVITVSRGDLGSYYSIDHGNGFYSLYVHINRTLAVGTKVKQGDVIATYLPSYNHLHFMIRKGGNSDAFNQNPENFINFNPNNQQTIMYDNASKEAQKMWNGDLPFDQAQDYINTTWANIVIQKDGVIQQLEAQNVKKDQWIGERDVWIGGRDQIIADLKKQLENATPENVEQIKKELLEIINKL